MPNLLRLTLPTLPTQADVAINSTTATVASASPSMANSSFITSAPPVAELTPVGINVEAANALNSYGPLSAPPVLSTSNDDNGSSSHSNSNSNNSSDGSGREEGFSSLFGCYSGGEVSQNYSVTTATNTAIVPTSATTAVNTNSNGEHTSFQHLSPKAMTAYQLAQPQSSARPRGPNDSGSGGISNSFRSTLGLVAPTAAVVPVGSSIESAISGFSAAMSQQTPLAVGQGSTIH
ncbi:hypothetical protein EV182_006531 [Spiromyces aspiralis]|uniref:Uncharacterized protein n=1 Tax=Spiromyces aspiralis TaxID=68401 RepID=A0ACC1HPF3_9FUNG|nr:hypothetical protein EV182_006531 [Spiromyces aspiralis]